MELWTTSLVYHMDFIISPNEETLTSTPPHAYKINSHLLMLIKLLAYFALNKTIILKF